MFANTLSTTGSFYIKQENPVHSIPNSIKIPTPVIQLAQLPMPKEKDPEDGVARVTLQVQRITKQDLRDSHYYESSFTYVPSDTTTRADLYAIETFINTVLGDPTLRTKVQLIITNQKSLASTNPNPGNPDTQTTIPLRKIEAYFLNKDDSGQFRKILSSMQKENSPIKTEFFQLAAQAGMAVNAAAQLWQSLQNLDFGSGASPARSY